MNIPSLKKFMIRQYELLPGTEDFKYHRLILVTAAGTICGTPVFEEDDNVEVGALFQKNHDLYHEYIDDNNIPDNTELEGNDGYIMLKDVSMMTSNQVTRLTSLIVFCDEIIGVTVGLME